MLSQVDAKTRTFRDRFSSKLGKIDWPHIEDYLFRLRDDNRFLINVLDSLNEGIIVTDEDLRIVLINRVGRRLLRLGPRQRHLGHLLDHCPPGELADLLANLRRRPREVQAYECRLEGGEGRRLTLTSLPLRATTVETPEASEQRWLYLLRDVTERYRSVEEQARAQRLASLALLTSGIAHEIKNPLNSLNIHAQILAREAEGNEEGLDSATVRRAAKVILEETARLTRIVDEFIQAARPTRPVMERRSLNPLIQDVAELFASECRQEGIELRVEPDPDLPPIDMDAHLMFQALRNLIRNAIEAHQEDRRSGRREASAPPPMIVVRTKVHGDVAAIEVADNGPGISQEDLKKIFEAYYTTKFRGTGLGLLVVHRVVTEHGGEIHVESHPGVGTRFVITLPLVERPVRLLEDSTAVGPSSPEMKP